MLIFFAEKMQEACIAKASRIFSTKNISVLGYKVVKHLDLKASFNGHF